MVAQNGFNPNAEAENTLAETKMLLEAIRKGRAGMSQPTQVISQLNGNVVKGKTPFTHMGDFFQSVKKIGQSGNINVCDKMKAYSNMLVKSNPTGMNETVGADGGYLVPPEFANQLLMRTYANDLLSRTVMFPLSNSNTLKIPAINETSRANGSRFGGVTSGWRAEGGAMTASKPSIDQVSLTVDSLYVAVQATQELIDDASGLALETFINLVATEELAFRIGDAIVNGDGKTKPLGIVNSACNAKITQAKETGQAAATILAANVLKMWSRLHVSCRQNAVWLIDQSIEPALATMTIGTAGGQLAVYQPAGGLSGLPYATLLGKPVLATEFGQPLGTEGDIILWDPTTYLTATKGGMQSASSIHVYFLTNEQVFRFIMRIDGKPWWFNPLTPKSGGPTQSCIVTLATRA